MWTKTAGGPAGPPWLPATLTHVDSRQRAAVRAVLGRGELRFDQRGGRASHACGSPAPVGRHRGRQRRPALGAASRPTPRGPGGGARRTCARATTADTRSQAATRRRACGAVFVVSRRLVRTAAATTS